MSTNKPELTNNCPFGNDDCPKCKPAQQPLSGSELADQVYGILVSYHYPGDLEKSARNQAESILTLIQWHDKALLERAFAAVRPEEFDLEKLYGNIPQLSRPGNGFTEKGWRGYSEKLGYNTALTDYDQNVKKYLEGQQAKEDK